MGWRVYERAFVCVRVGGCGVGEVEGRYAPWAHTHDRTRARYTELAQELEKAGR